MKLIVDIPEDVYKNIKEYYEKNDDVEATYSHIYYGIPLDDLRAEIVELWQNEPCAIEGGCLDEVLEIIDKYRGEKDETDN